MRAMLTSIPPHPQGVGFPLDKTMKTPIYLNIHTESQNLGGYDPNDEWSRDSFSYHHTFLGFSTQAVSYYSCLVNDFDINKQLYAVYVVYSTGDSFGSDEYARLEVIYIGHNPELADKIAQHIKDDYYKRDENNTNYKLVDIDGAQFHTYPWKGYFETLNYVKVEKGFAL